MKAFLIVYHNQANQIDKIFTFNAQVIVRMGSMLEFTEIKNRDAYHVIRGYVYQIDTTILAWLNLKDNEYLELEKGEDIDIINKNLKKGKNSRSLEQVKFRESKISLNQAGIIEILFNFYNHINQNPSHVLLFKYITNADYTVERPAIFPKSQSGINVWSQLAQQERIDERDERFLIIKDHLVSKASAIGAKLILENDKAATQWGNFIIQLNSPQFTAQLIKKFEWSIANKSGASLVDGILSKIQALTGVVDQTHADQVYARLFLALFKLLTKKGIKRVSKAELNSLITASETPNNEPTVLAIINQFLLTFNQKLEKLDQTVQSNSAVVTSLANQISQLQSPTAYFQNRLEKLATNPPNSITTGVKRIEKISEILRIFNNSDWIAIQGLNATGKSLLAADICRNFQTFYWLDLRPFYDDTNDFTLIIETFLSQISDVAIKSNRDDWMIDVVSKLQKNSLIVINDLPSIEHDSGLNLLTTLSKSIRNNVKLLSTSNHKVPPSLALYDVKVTEFTDLDFTESEILQYFNDSGYQNSIAGVLKLVVAISGGNTQIVSSILHNLKRGQVADDAVAVNNFLISNNFTNHNDLQLSLKKNIKEEDVRALLYRLSFITWNFTNEEVLSVSVIPEQIKHPNEKLQELVNIWIQDNKSSYQLSPLLYNIGSTNLSADQIQSIHIKLAESILKSGRLNAITALRCINEYIKGKSLDEACGVLLKVYQSTNGLKATQLLENWGLLHFWINTDVPKDVNIIMRANLRKEQIRLYNLLGKNVGFLVEELDSYTSETSDITEQVILRFLILSQYPTELVFEDYIRKLEFILDNYQKADRKIDVLFNQAPFSAFIWSSIQNIDTFDRMSLWTKTIEKVEDIFSISIFDEHIADAALNIIASQLQEKFDSDPHYLKGELYRFVTYFRNRANDNLASIFIKKIIAVIYRLDKNRELAYSIADQEIVNSNSQLGKYLINEGIGKLSFWDDASISKRYLEAALSVNHKDSFNHIDTLIFLASNSLVSPRESVKLCKEATYVALNNKDLSELDYLRALGELCIAYWRNNDKIDCFRTYEVLVKRLYDIKTEHFGEYWISIFSTTGHCLGYLCSIMATGKPVEMTINDEPYAEPFIGIYTLNPSNLSQIYNEKNDPMMMSQLSLYAEGLNFFDEAFYWAQKAFDEARRSRSNKLLYLTSSQYLRHSVCQYKVIEAFEVSEYYSSIMFHFEGKFEERFAALDNVKIEDILTSKPSENWNKAEDVMVSYCVLPLLISCLTKYILNNSFARNSISQLQNSIFKYSESASNKPLWIEINLLLQAFIDGKLETDYLITNLKTHAQNNNNNLYLINALLASVTTNDPLLILELEDKIYRHLFAKFNSQQPIIQCIISPFFKALNSFILKKGFVGDSAELASILETIDKFDVTENTIEDLIILVKNNSS